MNKQPAVCACGDHAFLPLGKGYVTLLDPEDIGKLGDGPWRAVAKRRRVYARGGIGGRQPLHRVIIEPDRDKEVDHINHNALDNRRRNLRACTTAENHFNSRPIGGSSKYKGVFLFTRTGKWQAQISHLGKKIHLGFHWTEEEAARAYDKAAVELRGEFAWLNFPSGD